jgi:hypothetical protein
MATMSLDVMDLKELNEGCHFDSAFVSFFMNKMFEKNEILNHTATGKKSKNNLSKPQLDYQKLNLMKG